MKRKLKAWVYLTNKDEFKLTLNYPLNMDVEDMNTAFEPKRIELNFADLPTKERKRKASK